MSELKSLLEPVSEFVVTLDLKNVEAAEAALEEKFPVGGEFVASLDAAARAGLADESLCYRGEDGVKFSRVVKPEADPAGCSIDAVYMTNAKGPLHTHTLGEVCFCVPIDGTPQFENRAATWMVLPPGSTHVPTVKDGSMLILYWWPEGAVAWG